MYWYIKKKLRPCRLCLTADHLVLWIISSMLDMTGFLSRCTQTEKNRPLLVVRERSCTNYTLLNTDGYLILQYLIFKNVATKRTKQPPLWKIFRHRIHKRLFLLEVYSIIIYRYTGNLQALSGLIDYAGLCTALSLRLTIHETPPFSSLVQLNCL